MSWSAAAYQVELAGAWAKSRATRRNDFRNIDPAEARHGILLLEAVRDRLLPLYPPKLSADAERSLTHLGVQTRTSAIVTGVDAGGVTVKTREGTERIAAQTILWAAGVQASPLGAMLAKRAGAKIDRAGRVEVAPDLSIPDHPEILVIGDLAAISQDGHPVPGLAPAAIQEGRYAAKLIQTRLKNENPAPFHYLDKGSLATIGRNSAVAQIGPLRFSGILAWLAWIFIHLLYIAEFENRLVIAVHWAYDYFAYNQGARLITGNRPMSE